MRVPFGKMNEILRDPSILESILGWTDDAENIGGTDIDQAWHGILFLLTGQKDDNSFLGRAITGGEVINGDFGIPPPRYLMPSEVKVISEELLKIPKEALAQKFDPKKMEKNKIIPGNWKRKGMLDYLLNNYVNLVNYYKAAADNGDAMIVYVS